MCPGGIRPSACWVHSSLKSILIVSPALNPLLSHLFINVLICSLFVGCFCWLMSADVYLVYQFRACLFCNDNCIVKMCRCSTVAGYWGKLPYNVISSSVEDVVSHSKSSNTLLSNLSSIFSQSASCLFCSVLSVCSLEKKQSGFVHSPSLWIYVSIVEAQ